MEDEKELSFDNEMKISIFSFAIVCFLAFIYLLNIDLNNMPKFFALCGILGILVFAFGVFKLMKTILKKIIFWLQNYKGRFKKVLNFLVNTVYAIVMLVAILCISVGAHY